MRALIVVVLVTAFRVAEAGPYCFTDIGFAPHDDSKLPVAPTIAYAVQERYYGGRRYANAKLPDVTATIDGKRVPMIWNDLRTTNGVIRLLSIRSQATGTLELWRTWEYGDGKPTVAATFTIVSTWTPPAEPGLRVAPGKDNGLGPYRWIGDHAELRVDLPAIAFMVKWREGTQAPWRSIVVPAHPHDAGVEAWLGEETCGMRENIPLAALAKGVEIEIRAKLPNGRDVPVTTAPTTLLFVPDPAPKPQRATQPPPAE